MCEPSLKFWPSCDKAPLRFNKKNRERETNWTHDTQSTLALKNMWPLKKWTPRNAIQISYQQHPELVEDGNYLHRNFLKWTRKISKPAIPFRSRIEAKASCQSGLKKTNFVFHFSYSKALMFKYEISLLK